MKAGDGDLGLELVRMLVILVGDGSDGCWGFVGAQWRSSNVGGVNEELRRDHDNDRKMRSRRGRKADRAVEIWIWK